MVVIAEPPAGNRIASHRARQRRYWLPGLSGGGFARIATGTTRTATATKISKDGFALMAYLGWVITSIRYGKPFFTDARPASARDRA